jgi:hypothetical protein
MGEQVHPCEAQHAQGEVSDGGEHWGLLRVQHQSSISKERAISVGPARSEAESACCLLQHPKRTRAVASQDPIRFVRRKRTKRRGLQPAKRSTRSAHLAARRIAVEEEAVHGLKPTIPSRTASVAHAFQWRGTWRWADPSRASDRPSGTSRVPLPASPPPARREQPSREGGEEASARVARGFSRRASSWRIAAPPKRALGKGQGDTQ